MEYLLSTGVFSTLDGLFEFVAHEAVGGNAEAD